MIDEMTGSLSVLNVGAGDLEFRFDRGSKAEVERAKKVVTDMLKRGYVIFAEVNGTLHKVVAFDATAGRYIIADGAPDPEPAAEPGPAPPAEATAPRRRGRPKGSKNKSVPMESVKATAIGPTAGG